MLRRGDNMTVKEADKDIKEIAERANDNKCGIKFKAWCELDESQDGVEDNEEVFGLEVNGKIFDSYISKDEVVNDIGAILYGAKLELERLTKQIDKLVKMLVEQS